MDCQEADLKQPVNPYTEPTAQQVVVGQQSVRGGAAMSMCLLHAHFAPSMPKQVDFRPADNGFAGSTSQRSNAGVIARRHTGGARQANISST